MSRHDADHRRDAELARDDGAVRQHAAALDDQPGDEREDRPPSRVGLSRDEDVARNEPLGVGDVIEDRRARLGLPAARPGAAQFGLLVRDVAAAIAAGESAQDSVAVEVLADAERRSCRAA